MTTPNDPPVADVLLTDGTIATIRAFQPRDRDDLNALNEQLSDDATRMRYFSVDRLAGPHYVSHLVAAEPDRSLALVAHRHGELVAIASAEIDGTSAEIAFLVADAMRGLGLGTLLLEHLAAAARDIGIRTFTAEVLTENHPMLQVFADAGYVATRTIAGTTTSWEISTAPAEAVLSAADQRERMAEARSLRPLLYPRSVAILGVRRDGAGIGNAVLRSIASGRFTGSVQVVHPTAEQIGGLAAHRSLRDIDEHVDVAVIAVPAAAVLDAVTDAAEAGVSAAVVITSGFGELGPDGESLQRRIVQVAREHDLRLVGPNCLGLLCNHDSIGLNATFSSAVPPSGGLAIASQSGGVGIALLDLACEQDLGVHSFVSLGNQPDVTASDLISAWQDDPLISAGALYLESFGNPRKFARLARRFSENKPLLAVAGGRSAGGARAGASHTASAASPAVGIEALFSQAGVISCRTADDLVHTARLLTEQPLPRGNRVAIVSNAGGLAILAADTADELGLRVPELSEQLKARVGAHLSGTIGVGNPVDLGAGALPDDVAAVVELLTATDEVDAVLVVVIPTSAGDPRPYLHAVEAGRQAGPDKPVLLVTMGGLQVGPKDAPSTTAYRTSQDALTALQHATRYAEWRRSPRTEQPEHDLGRAQQARKTVRAFLEDDQESRRWLAPDEQKLLLAPYGISPVGRTANGHQEAARIASEIGFPVAVKVADPQVNHKTDRGLVRVGLWSPSSVDEAVRSFEAELHDDQAPVLVQPVLSGVELALGLVRHASFGPLVMVAAGGVATDIWADRTFLMPPLTRQDAARALRSLRIWPLLQGYRGTPAVDLEALETLVLGLAQLAEDVPEIVELDLNPVLATPDGADIVDIRVRVVPDSGRSAPLARQLTSARRR